MNLMPLLPDYYENNETMITLQTILEQATTDLDAQLSATIRECFLVTASVMLSRYEKIMGVEVNTSLDDQRRIERIKAKLAGRGTSTVEMIKEIAAIYSNGAVEITEDNANSRFTITFTGTLGVPQNLEALKLTIEEIKPAHLEALYEFIYNTHGDLKLFTHGQLAAYTHQELFASRLRE